MRSVYLNGGTLGKSGQSICLHTSLEYKIKYVRTAKYHNEVVCLKKYWKAENWKV